MLKVHTAIICDDIRKEHNGKNILIGVYNSDMLIPVFPTTYFLSFWAQVSSDTPRPYDIDFRMKFDGKKVAELSGTSNITVAHEMAAISIPPLPFEFKSPGTLIFQFREKNKRWKTIRKLLIKQQ